MYRFSLLTVLIPSLLVQAACAPVVVGGATAGGIAVAQERTFGSAIDDATIHSRILKRFFETDVNDLLTGVSVEVQEGTVLLTGQVNKPETAIEAVKQSWQVDGVREVINEIQVTDSSKISTYAKDTFITGRIRTRLVAEKGVYSVNYSIETVRGVVYVMGLAHNQEELEKVLYLASTVKGVKQVVSHVRLVSDPRRDANKIAQ